MMKKLLFAGFMSVGFTLMGGQEQNFTQEQRESIYLMDYCQNKDKLSKIPMVECSKINALSAEQFDALLDKLFTRGMLIIHFYDCSDQYEKYKDIFNKEYALAMRINKCRSIAPFFCKAACNSPFFEEQLSRTIDLRELSEDAFKEWKKAALKLNKQIKWEAFWFQGWWGGFFQDCRKAYEEVISNNERSWGYEPDTAFLRILVSPEIIKEIELLRKK